MTWKVPSIEEAEEALGIPKEGWAGNCYWAACQFIKEGLVPEGSRAVYGLWTGYIDPVSWFAGRSITHHGWVRMPCKQIVDPTRWVFLNSMPFVYVGKEDPAEYDFGGNRTRRSARVPCPAKGRGKKYAIPKALLTEVRALTGLKLKSGELGIEQLLWLANRDPLMFNNPRNVYAWIIDAGHVAFIPIDNRREFGP